MDAWIIIRDHHYLGVYYSIIHIVTQKCILQCKQCIIHTNEHISVCAVYGHHRFTLVDLDNSMSNQDTFGPHGHRFL